MFLYRRRYLPSSSGNLLSRERERVLYSIVYIHAPKDYLNNSNYREREARENASPRADYMRADFLLVCILYIRLWRT